MNFRTLHVAKKSPKGPDQQAARSQTITIFMHCIISMVYVRTICGWSLHLRKHRIAFGFFLLN